MQAQLELALLLLKKQDDKEVVIAYNGCGLTEREALALVEGIKKFQPYLFGRKFLVITVHSSLRWLMNVKDATGCLARWSLLLQQYDFDIVHRPGKEHSNVDSLSRRPYETKPDLSSFQQEDPQLARTREMQRRDPELSEIIDFLENDTVPPNDKLARKILLFSDTFYIGQYGLLYHLDQNQNRNNHEAYSQLVIPHALKFEILSNVHNHISGAHFGVHKTFQKVKQRYWWKCTFKDIEHWCKSCQDCSTRKTPRNSKRAPLLPIPVGNAFDQVAVAAEAFVIARLLVDEIIARPGAPKVLLSDRGRTFCLNLLPKCVKYFRFT